MSKHSKNNTSSNVFTYGERRMLKGLYGTVEHHVGQDSQKLFEHCTICQQLVNEPMACEQGHLFCNTCVVQYMVKQKKDKELKNKKYQEEMERLDKIKEQKQAVEQHKKIDLFQKYEHFTDVNVRKKFLGTDEPEKAPELKIRPTGKYEIDNAKQDYTKTSFWANQQTPKYAPPPKKEDTHVVCPGGNHKLLYKKMRSIKLKRFGEMICCSLCNKEISRQKVGVYKCGHLLCVHCKGGKCEMCDQTRDWLELESSASSFAAQGKSVIKKYTHAFVS